MKRILITLLVIIGIAIPVVFLLPKQSVKEASTKLTFAMIESNIKNGATLYDVRTAEEYETSHFGGAINWSLENMTAGKLPDIAKSTEIYLYCRSGNRSAKAMTILKDAGFTNVTDLGGLSAVEAIGGQLAAK